MNPIDLDRLKAAAFHETEIAETPDPAETKFCFRRVDYPNYTELSIDEIQICIFHKSLSDKLPVAMFDDISVFRTPRDFEIAIALLQEAKRLIVERETK